MWVSTGKWVSVNTWQVRVNNWQVCECQQLASVWVSATGKCVIINNWQECVSVSNWQVCECQQLASVWVSTTGKWESTTGKSKPRYISQSTFPTCLCYENRPKETISSPCFLRHNPTSVSNHNIVNRLHSYVKISLTKMLHYGLNYFRIIFKNNKVHKSSSKLFSMTAKALTSCFGSWPLSSHCYSYRPLVFLVSCTARGAHCGRCFWFAARLFVRLLGQIYTC